MHWNSTVSDKFLANLRQGLGLPPSSSRVCDASQRNDVAAKTTECAGLAEALAKAERKGQRTRKTEKQLKALAKEVRIRGYTAGVCNNVSRALSEARMAHPRGRVAVMVYDRICVTIYPWSQYKNLRQASRTDNHTSQHHQSVIHEQTQRIDELQRAVTRAKADVSEAVQAQQEAEDKAAVFQRESAVARGSVTHQAGRTEALGRQLMSVEDRRSRLREQQEADSMWHGMECREPVLPLPLDSPVSGVEHTC